MLCLSIPITGFHHFYYSLGAKLGSHLHGDVSVMKIGMDIETQATNFQLNLSRMKGSQFCFCFDLIFRCRMKAF